MKAIGKTLEINWNDVLHILTVVLLYKTTLRQLKKILVRLSSCPASRRVKFRGMEGNDAKNLAEEAI